MSIEIIERLGPCEERTKKHEYENINKRTYIQSIHTSTNFGRPDGAPDHVSPTPPQQHTTEIHHPHFRLKMYTIYDKTEHMAKEDPGATCMHSIFKVLSPISTVLLNAAVC